MDIEDQVINGFDAKHSFTPDDRSYLSQIEVSAETRLGIVEPGHTPSVLVHRLTRIWAASYTVSSSSRRAPFFAAAATVLSSIGSIGPAQLNPGPRHLHLP